MPADGTSPDRDGRRHGGGGGELAAGVGQPPMAYVVTSGAGHAVDAAAPVRQDRAARSLHGVQHWSHVRPKIHGYTGCKRACAVEQAVSSM